MRAIGCVWLLAVCVAVAAGGKVSPSQACVTQSGYPFCDTRLSIAERVQDLISRLTIDDKVGLMGDNTTGVPSLGIPKFSLWSEALHGPNIKCYVDAAGGHHCPTTFPAGINMGASFNMDLVKSVGAAIGSEMRAAYNLGVHNIGHKDQVDPVGPIVYTPNINIYRDPRWGRGQETPGEDPFLSGKYATAMIQGLQGSADPKYLKLAATVKHFAAYSAEYYHGIDRTRLNFNVSAQDLAQTFLPHFEAAIKDGGVRGVMCSYNEINGVPSCGNKWLLQDTLRNQWKFTGYVEGDCWAVGAMLEGHHYVKSPVEAAAVALAAGTDNDCYVEDAAPYAVNISNIYQAYMKQAYEQGLVTLAQIDQALTRVFTIEMQLGMFDPADQLPYANLDENVLDAPEHRLMARQIARESLVLLKNDKHLLPLTVDARPGAKPLKVAVIGPQADNEIALLSNYHGACENVVSILRAFQNAAGVEASFAQGCVLPCNGSEGFAAAAAAAKVADVAIVAVGIDLTVEAEGGDRESIALPGAQNALVSAVLSAQPRTVVVLVNGGMVGLETVARAPALLEAFYPGEEGGNAVVDVLLGLYNPSGRLPITYYPVSFPDTADFFNFDMRKAPGLTYRFYQHTPVYPFGYGLSYTTFKYAIAQASRTVVAALDSEADYDVTVTNVGPVGGAVSVLGFVSLHANVPFAAPLAAPHAPVHKLVDQACPLKQLFDFQKLYLAPGASQTLKFTVTPAAALCVDLAGHKIAHRGSYTVTLGEATAQLNVV